jgi:hypothetical protein
VNGELHGLHRQATVLVAITTLVLLITALAKILALTGDMRSLETADPVIQVFSVRQLMAIGAGLEIIVAGIGFSRLPVRIKCWALAWLSSLFLLYRFARWYLGVSEPCKCLGDVWQWLPVSRAALDAGLLAFLVVVWVGSCMGVLTRRTFLRG